LTALAKRFEITTDNFPNVPAKLEDIAFVFMSYVKYMVSEFTEK
jgi:hypothetical protein